MKTYILLFFIVLLGFILRFYMLGVNPPSLDWDEASLGYNAYSILKTGADEYGRFLPLSIRSFGDFKPGLYTYSSIIPVVMFGLTEYAVRFPSAFFGILTVLISFFLARELVAHHSSKFALLFSLFFAISPWHLQFSRIAFESNVSIFFVLFGVLLFIRSFKNKWLMVGSMLSFGLSMYAYHSPRLVVPILIFAMTIIYFQRLRRNLSYIIVCYLLFVILSIPILLQLKSGAAARFSSVSVITPDRLEESIKQIETDQKTGDDLGALVHNRRIIFGKEVLGGYLDHFDLDFLFLKGDPPLRHHVNGMGMMYVVDAIFILFGTFLALRFRNQGVKVILIWLAIAPLASALTTGTPHAVRALLMVVPLIFLASFGFYYLSLRYKFFSWGMSCILVACFYYYLNLYWIHAPVEASQDWQYGYKQAVETVKPLEDRYSKIIVTYRYDQPYVFFLFYNAIDPTWYQRNWGGGEILRSNRSFGKYEFRNIEWEKDSKLTNVLFIGTPAEIPSTERGIIQEIKFLDGSIAFRILAR